jgi:transposase
MSKHSVPAGDICALLTRFSSLKQKAFARTGKLFPIVVIQEAGLDGFWIHRALQKEGIESHVGAGEPRLIGSTARRCFAHCWRISAANLGCVLWSKRRLRRKRTAVGFAASARF